MSWKRISVLGFVLAFTFVFAAIAAAGPDVSVAPDKSAQLKRSTYGMLMDASDMEADAMLLFVAISPGHDIGVPELDGSEDVVIGGIVAKSGLWCKKAMSMLDYAWSEWEAGRYYKAAYAAQSAEMIFESLVEFANKY